MLERLRLSPQLIVLVGIALGILGAVGTVAIVISDRDSQVIIYNDPTDSEIVVEIRGEVTTPGVYHLPRNARLVDLINAAGGALPSAGLADQNLARRLDDAEIVTIAARGLATPISASISNTPAPSTSLSFRININTANAIELESLPGIGPVIAERIVQYRSTNGPFATTNELTEIEGISENLLKEIQTLITVGP